MKVKVKCISIEGWEIYLTVGKIYDVIDYDGLYYHLKADDSYMHFYPKECFKSISEIRNDEINKLLGE